MEPRPPTKLEVRIIECWASELGIDSSTINLSDNFFALGGDSLVSLRLVGRAKRNGISFNVCDLFEYPTIISLANSADER